MGTADWVRIVRQPWQNCSMRSFAAILTALFLLSACGESGADESVASLSSTTTSTTAAATDSADANEVESAVLAFTACLREAGVDVPDPTVDSEGNPRFSAPPDLSDVTPDQLNEALGSCREELNRVTIGVIGTDLTGIEDTLLEYAQCMRQNGFDMPDPKLDLDFGSEGGFEGPFGQIDFDDPDFVAADEQCASIVEELGARR